MDNETKAFMTIKWNADLQQYFVGYIGMYTDYNGNSFIDTEECFPTKKTMKEIIDFLAE